MTFETTGWEKAKDITMRKFSWIRRAMSGVLCILCLVLQFLRISASKGGCIFQCARWEWQPQYLALAGWTTKIKVALINPATMKGFFRFGIFPMLGLSPSPCRWWISTDRQA